MANANRPWGLKPVGYHNGSPWNGKATMYCIPSGDTNAYAIGDPVVLAGSANSNGVPHVTVATAGSGNLITGAIVALGGRKYGGALANYSNLDQTVLASTAKAQDFYCLVADDPSILFEIQEYENTAALAASDVGTNIDLVSSANNGYVSQWMIDTGTMNTGSTRQMQILRLAQRADNAIGTYAKWVCRINYHSFNQGQSGV